MKRRNIFAAMLLFLMIGLYSCKATDCGCPKFEVEAENKMNAEAW